MGQKKKKHSASKDTLEIWIIIVSLKLISLFREDLLIVIISAIIFIFNEFICIRIIV
jgi:hypothetical protein